MRIQECTSTLMLNSFTFGLKKHTMTAVSWIVPLILLGCLSGACTPVEGWKMFEPDFEASVPREADDPGSASATASPETLDAPAVELPPPGRPLRLSVEDVTVLALQRNRDLKTRQLNPVIAGTFERIERGRFDPELFAEFSYDEATAQEISRATGQEFSVDSSGAESAMGIRQELPSGTSVEASLSQQRDQSNRAPDQRMARVGLSVTQSLLQGFGPAVTLLSIRQAELDTLASLYELRGFTETLVAEAESAYWNYVLALKEIRIFESSLAVARQQLDEVEQQIEVGLLPEIEAAAARAEVARRKQALIDARSLMEERRLRLVRLIDGQGTGQADRRILAVSDPMIDPRPIRDQEQRVRLALRSRSDLAEAGLRRQQGRLETIVTKNGMLPRLDLFLRLGQTGYAESFGASFQSIDGDTSDFSIGLRLNHFLGNRAAEARHQASLASHSQALEAVDNLRQIVRLDVRLAVNEVERTRKQIAASTATRRLEEQALRAEKERFAVGASTALLVAQVQRDLLVSQIAEVRAIINYRLALVQLYLAEGSLLERRGIVFDAG